MKNLISLLILMLLLAACGAEPTVAPTETAVVEESAESDHGHDHNDAQSDVHGLDTSLFLDGALEEEATIQDCTLADGTETTCYAITIAGYPANHDVGPFCPETTLDSAEAGGIWFDGNGVYDLDGNFILGLAELYNDNNWKLYDDDGNVNVTDTEEAFDAAARPNVDPEYQNHCVEGRIEWLDNGEPVPTTVLIPTTPVVGASATQANGNLGVTLNGVIIAAPAPVDAILSAYTIAAFDDCGGHINPVDGYHLHGARGCSDVGEAVDGETPIFAYALDGYAIHSPFDEADEAAAGLDACQGHTTEADGYHYHAASAEDNAVLSCFMGVTVDGSGDEGPGGGGPQGDRGDGPDLAAAAATLGVSEDDLRAALGGPPPDFDAAAAALGISVDVLQAALGGDGGQAAPPEQADAPVENSAETSQPASLANSGYLDSYTISDTGYGTEVNVTVDSSAETRTIASNTLPNHDTGEFPNSGNPNTISAQDASWTFTTEPAFVGSATFARTPGVAINGVKFEPDTAERADCETGEVHSIEAIQDVTDLGLDFNNAHVQPTGEYHYHGVSDLLVDLYSSDQDLVHVAFAADGHLIYYSKSGAYQSSYRLGADERAGTNCTYTPGGPNGGATITFGSEKDGSLKSDWAYDASYGQLDECNGITIDGQYIYLITNDYPYIPRCLMGEFAESGGSGGAPQGAPPDLEAAATALGVSEDVLRDALGAPPPDFEAAAMALGVTVEALQDALGVQPQP